MKAKYVHFKPTILNFSNGVRLNVKPGQEIIIPDTEWSYFNNTGYFEKIELQPMKIESKTEELNTEEVTEEKSYKKSYKKRGK